jgi:hypothetical protein
MHILGRQPACLGDLLAVVQAAGGFGGSAAGAECELGDSGLGLLDELGVRDLEVLGESLVWGQVVDSIAPAEPLAEGEPVL